MKEEWPIIKKNLLIFGGIVVLLLIGDTLDGFREMTVTIIGLMIIPTAMGVVLLIIGIVHLVNGDRTKGRAHLLSALLIPIIGTSLCFGGGAVFSSF